MSEETAKTPSGLVLHHLEDSRSQRVLWLLEELQVPYTIKHYKRTKSGLAPRELKAIHPLGKSPIVTDGDLTIAESGAVIEYLLKKYGNGRFEPPSNREAELRNSYYSHFSEGTMMPYLVNFLVFTIIPRQVPWFLRWLIRPIMEKVKSVMVLPNLSNAADMIERDLGQSSTGWIAGGPEPTSADFMMLFPLEGLPFALGKDKLGPNTRGWLELAHKRPAYARALEKGGKYAYAKL
ncbi:hypothetical protein FRC14_004106 [Serendipita sp. 396]|nr:hypothetical protein FRC14_004106 [Serendipita sp. 396]KAG8782517.1 hypothetical protein FRC15_006851 [Serendipita sp. 397]KAG8798381.1 hypothetical protein FRC16_007346 [Serendipita sp. 398]KAG8824928.1 hypothetical protein FRC19_000805 [Serendipita sp. 401]KAG8829715.1 hypothetical protein FRC18_009111 [Serendipita sp. 400]KAG8858121.1 hypothetical protein FRB91_010338 [Serendipita sp. 411]KAG8866651.1 hypothetical protein FRC20_007897 [Serendipita sp. 405]KAG9055857.1 hypothetical prot